MGREMDNAVKWQTHFLFRIEKFEPVKVFVLKLIKAFLMLNHGASTDCYSKGNKPCVKEKCSLISAFQRLSFGLNGNETKSACLEKSSAGHPVPAVLNV